MPPHQSRSRSPRPLVRAFFPCRLAADALARSYQHLLPDSRRSLPLSPGSSPAAQPRPRRLASG